MLDTVRGFRLVLAPCSAGSVLPLVCTETPAYPQHRAKGFPLPDCGSQWRVGTILLDNTGTPLLKVIGRVMIPVADHPHAQIAPLLEALRDIEGGPAILSSQRSGWALGWITLSDKGATGERIDESGPAMAAQTAAVLPLCHQRGFLLPDNPLQLRSLVTELTLGQGYDLILTSGGTGLSPRDTTPEALLPLFDRRLHGFEQAMMQASLLKTPTAAISRGVAGTVDHSIIITLPGSRKAVAENLEAVLPALGHALDKLHGDPTDCGR